MKVKIYLSVFSCLSLWLSSISSLGRNIILTSVPAGTKLIAGNKPVSFVTAQQFQQLQQQGQATQVSGFLQLLFVSPPTTERKIQKWE